MTLTLFVCAECGTPVELSEPDAASLPIWERRLRQPLVIHCVECAKFFTESP
jgi:hypothetical protein